MHLGPFHSTAGRIWAGASYMNIVPVHLCKLILSVRSGRVCSLETSWASECACESHWTSCPHRGHPLDDTIPACTHRLLLCRKILCGGKNEWANLVEMASIQGLNPIAVQPGSMEAGLLCKHFFKTVLSPKTSIESMLHTFWTSV
jgi:hypothetical protein